MYPLTSYFPRLNSLSFADHFNDTVGRTFILMPAPPLHLQSVLNSPLHVVWLQLIHIQLHHLWSAILHVRILHNYIY